MKMLKPSELLKERKWLRGKTWQRDKSGEIVGCCMLGAYLLAVQMLEGEDKSIDSLIRKYSKLCDDVGGDPGLWNDMKGRTKEQCIAKFRQHKM